MSSLLNLKELVSGTHGKIIGSRIECFFESVATDSRQVQKNTMFVPLVGEFQDGHKYIPSSIEKGASVVLLNESEYNQKKEFYNSLAEENEKVVFVCVENTLHGLQDAAETYVSKFPELLKISITGSSGKTTTKEMLVSVFNEEYGNDLVYTQGNLNSETGLPLSVFNIRENHKVGIFEMGMNRVNEIAEISKVLKSQVGIITNIGTAHIGILGSRENIAKEKRHSFDYIPRNGAAFVPADDDFAGFCTKNVRGKVIKYGRSVPEKKDGVIFIEDKGLFGTKFSLDGVEINLPLCGDYNYQNALGVVACAKFCGISVEKIKSGIENVSAVGGRMEALEIVLKSGKNAVLIKDCYNANLDSMTKSVEFTAGISDSGKKIFVLADMKELGAKSEESHRIIGKKLAELNADYVFFVGPEMKYAFSEADGKIKVFWYENNSSESFSAIAEKINEIAEDKDVILIKGSHSMELEKLIPLLGSCRERK